MAREVVVELTRIFGTQYIKTETILFEWKLAAL